MSRPNLVDLTTLADYEPIPSTYKRGVFWHVISVGRTPGDCEHSHCDSTVWYAGPGGPLIEIKCLDCKRHLREQLVGRNHSWPVEDKP